MRLCTAAASSVVLWAALLGLLALLTPALAARHNYVVTYDPKTIDENLPDHSKVGPGALAVKKWRLINHGAEIISNYEVVWLAGASFEATSSVLAPVAPAGKEFVVGVAFKIPRLVPAGTMSSTFGLRSKDDGKVFARMYLILDVDTSLEVAKPVLDSALDNLMSGFQYVRNKISGGVRTRHLIYYDRYQDLEFEHEVTQLSARLGIPDPNMLVACMGFETGLSFKPDQKNYGGSGATGLIQFMPATARDLGTSISALQKMTRVQQLVWVGKYMNQKCGGKCKTVADLYMAILWPRGIGKPLTYTLFTNGDGYYKSNKGLDTNGDDKITKSEAAAAVQRTLDSGIAELEEAGEAGYYMRENAPIPTFQLKRVNVNDDGNSRSELNKEDEEEKNERETANGRGDEVEQRDERDTTLSQTETQTSSNSQTPITSTTPYSFSYDAKTVDVTVPDGTAVGPGQKLVKTWLVTNNGAQRWPGSVDLRLESGGEGFQVTNKRVARIKPGKPGKISASITTPSLDDPKFKEGTHKLVFHVEHERDYIGKLTAVVKLQREPVPGRAQDNPVDVVSDAMGDVGDAITNTARAIWNFVSGTDSSGVTRFNMLKYRYPVGGCKNGEEGADKKDICVLWAGYYHDSNAPRHTWPGCDSLEDRIGSCRTYGPGIPEGQWGHNDRAHDGLDLSSEDPTGSAGHLDIVAAADGVVMLVGYDDTAHRHKFYGRHVVLLHADGLRTFYFHMTVVNPEIKAGAMIKCGTVLGKMGWTGNVAPKNAKGTHLHFMVVDNSKFSPNSVDYFKAYRFGQKHYGDDRRYVRDTIDPFEKNMFLGGGSWPPSSKCMEEHGINYAECPIAKTIKCGNTIHGSNTQSGHFLDHPFLGTGSGVDKFNPENLITHTGGKVAYRFKPKRPNQRVTIKLTGMTADLDLVLLKGEGTCDPWDYLASSAKGSSGFIPKRTNDDEMIQISLAKNYHTIVVAGFEGAQSEFDLTVTCE